MYTIAGSLTATVYIIPKNQREHKFDYGLYKNFYKQKYCIDNNESGDIKMKVIDTFQEIPGCYKNNQFDQHLWEAYAQKIAPGFAEKIKTDAADYNFEQDILPVLNAVPQNGEQIKQAYDSFCKVTNQLEEKIKDKLGAELDVDIVLYLGLCNGAGWATELNGTPAVLLGVEKILELGWYDERDMIGLIYHELGHIWHFQTRSKDNQWTAKDRQQESQGRALWQLYTEGVAMYIEHLLCGDENFYHQDKGGWLDWCQSNRQSLYAEFIRRIDTAESTQDFFGDWCNYQGRSDVGYYLGCELVKELAREYSLKELADLSLDVIYQQLCKM